MDWSIKFIYAIKIGVRQWTAFPSELSCRFFFHIFILKSMLVILNCIDGIISNEKKNSFSQLRVGTAINQCNTHMKYETNYTDNINF